MYKLRDLQFEDRFFGGGQGIIFKDKKEVCEQLISYHSNDCNMSVERKLLKQGKIEKCLNELFFFEWELIKLTN